MKKKTNTSYYIRKILGILIVLVLFSGIGVLAVNSQVEDVKIILQNGYELSALTSKKKVADILAENNIMLESDEKVTPGLEEEIKPGTVIEITNKSKREVQIATISKEGVETSIDELLKNYAPITEKLIKEQQPIPFETITKDSSENSNDTTSKVLKEGEDGIKEITYKVKIQNNEEIERTLLSEVVIKEPVSKIVQVNKKAIVTARASTIRTAAPVGGEIYEVTAYCSCSKCCGSATGRTASGTIATPGRTVAAPAKFAFGTKLNIGGTVYTVEDRGGAIKGNRIDIFVSSHQEALNWGRRRVQVSVL